MSAAHLTWSRDGQDWPNRAASRFVHAAGLDWHYQDLGQGSPLLLLHGTGASTHSFRDLAPLLAKSHRVIVPDLPGHGFTSTPPTSRLTLPGMAGALSELMRALDIAPSLIVGHSAGAALAVQMVLDGSCRAQTIIALNGALLPFGGIGRHVFPSLAKLLFLNSLAPHVFAWRAQDLGAVERVLTGTGSRIDPVGLKLYARLFRSPQHVAATLAMMANWDLNAFEKRLPGVSLRLVLVAGATDRAVPADTAFQVRDLVKGSEVVVLRGLGHLAHEEDPAQVARIILDAAASAAAA